MELKSKSDIMLDEKINQVDDFNLDKLFAYEEDVTPPQQDILIPDIELVHQTREEKLDATDDAFSLEVMPNEFFDNISFKEETLQNKQKFHLNLSNKPLFVALTSIAVMLCILFIYNLFVLGGLERKVATMPVASFAYSVVEKENNYILFSNGNQLSINIEQVDTQSFAQTNWFNDTCESLDQLFGGKY